MVGDGGCRCQGPGARQYFDSPRLCGQMIRQVIQVENRLGLHARAAAKLVRLACRFASSVHVSREGANQRIDAKSILGVLMLSAAEGTRLVLLMEGQDEAVAGQAIRGRVEGRVGEANGMSS